MVDSRTRWDTEPDRAQAAETGLRKKPTLLAVATTATALTLDAVQPFNCASGSITNTALPALSSASVGDTYWIEKTDNTSGTTLTQPFAGSDATQSGLTQVQLTHAGKVEITAVASPAGGGAKFWAVNDHVRSDATNDASFAPIRALSPGINVTNPRGLRRFSAAIGDALFSRIPIICVGDSVTFGQGADNINSGNNIPDNTQGYVGQLRTLMNTLYGTTPGEGYIFNTDSRVTFTGAQTGANAYSGPLRHSTRLLSGQTYSFTVPSGVSTLRVVQANNSGDVTGSYTKNGGGSVALTTLTGTGVSITTDIAVANGDAIVISGPASAQTYITGLVLINGTAGVAVHRVGISGYVIGDAIGGQTSGTLNLTSGQQTSAIKKHYDWEPTPGLLTIAFGLNDQSFNATGGTTAQAGVTAAKYQTWLQAFCTQAVADGWCVLIVGENHNPTPGTGDTEAQYAAARKAVAQATDHVAAVELADVFGSASAASTLGITVTSSVHPSRKGHGYYARLLANLLTTPFGDLSPTA